MNIAICDDDMKYINKIQELLLPYKKMYSLAVSAYTSGEKFMEDIIEGYDCDILFLDIEMSQISGIEIAKQMREIKNNVIIIFITSHYSFVSDAFRLDAFQFLLKPLDEKNFCYDFERALHLYETRHKQYVIKWRGVSSMLEYNKIFYIEAYSRHLFVYTDDKKYECVGKLGAEYEKLKIYNFVRCHQGYIVNMEKIKRIEGTEIELKNNVKIPVSRNYKTSVMEIFNLYLAGKRV